MYLCKSESIVVPIFLKIKIMGKHILMVAFLTLSLNIEAQSSVVFYESFDGVDYYEDEYKGFEASGGLLSASAQADKLDNPDLMAYSTKAVGGNPEIGHGCIGVGTYIYSSKFAIPVNFTTEYPMALSFRFAPALHVVKAETSSSVLYSIVENVFDKKSPKEIFVDGEKIKGQLSNYKLQPMQWHSIRIVYSKVEKEGYISFSSKFVSRVHYSGTKNNSKEQSSKFLLDDVKLEILDNSPVVEYAQSQQNTFGQCKFANVRLDRTISNRYWNTLCLPFGLTRGQIHQLFGEKTIVQEYTGEENGNMKFDQVQTTKPGVPYIIKPEHTVENPLFQGVEITGEEPKCIDYNGFAFTGIYNPLKNEEVRRNCYLGVDGKLRYMAKEYIMNGFRCYITLPAGQTMAKVSFGDTTSSVEMPADDRNQAVAAFYNLLGQKINTTYRGIVINRGRKVYQK